MLGDSMFSHTLGNLLAQSQSRVYSVDQVLSPYVYVFYAAFIVAFLFTPIMRAVASFYGVIDRPDKVRKMHAEPVAYLGGVAVFLGWLSGLAMSQFVQLHRLDVGWTSIHPVIKFSIVLGALLIIALGLWDDLYGVKPKVKILFQVIAAIFLLLDDVGLECTRPTIEPVLARMYPWLSGGQVFDSLYPPLWFHVLIWVSSSLLVVTVIVGCCNATN